MIELSASSSHGIIPASTLVSQYCCHDDPYLPLENSLESVLPGIKISVIRTGQREELEADVGLFHRNCY